MLSRLLVTPLGRALGILLAVLLLLPELITAPSAQEGADAPAFKPEELEQIAAPIALYPDPLVAQVLMASTYPLEVVQAARFVKANSSLKGDQLGEALKKESWDDSVKALAEFPQVLAMMSEKLDWTQKLGDAFLDQQKELMDAVQRLRGKAQAQGNLKDSKEQKVVVEPAPPPAAGQPVQQTTIIKIEPANPQVVYVPTYNPTVVYGGWPYPAYPPYYYYPPGYAMATAATAALSFGVGMAVGASLWGGCNWGRGNVDINVNQYNNFTKNVNNTNIANQRSQIQNTRASGGQGSFQHDPAHRGGAQYRNTSTQQKFNKTGAANPQSREAFRGRAEQGRQELGRGGGAGDRSSPGAARGGGAAGGDRSSLGGGDRGGGARAQQHGGGSVGQRGGGGGAFEGVGQGQQTRSFSDRGQSSRASAGRSSGSMSAGGGSRGGGGGAAARGGGGGSRGGGGGRRR